MFTFVLVVVQVKVWTIPDAGLLGTQTDWSADLHGHSRRVAYVDWHTSAANILMSVGFDFKVGCLMLVVCWLWLSHGDGDVSLQLFVCGFGCLTFFVVVLWWLY